MTIDQFEREVHKWCQIAGASAAAASASLFCACVLYGVFTVGPAAMLHNFKYGPAPEIEIVAALSRMNTPPEPDTRALAAEARWTRLLRRLNDDYRMMEELDRRFPLRGFWPPLDHRMPYGAPK